MTYEIQIKRNPEQQQEVVRELIEWVAQGLTISEFSRKKNIGSTALYSYIKNSPDGLREEFARAKDAGYDTIADDMLSIADAAPERVEGRVDPGEVANRKLRIWTRQQLLSKWSPKKYGDKVTLSGDEENPIKHSVDVNFV